VAYRVFIELQVVSEVSYYSWHLIQAV